MALTKNTKIILAASGIILTGATIAILVSRSKWKRGGLKKSEVDKFDPEKQEMIAYTTSKGSNIRSTPELIDTSRKAELSTSEWWVTTLLTGGGAMVAANRQYTSTKNLLGYITSGRIGVVVEQTQGKRGFTWYKVKLDKPLKGDNYGWVREDVTKLKIVNK